VASEHLRQRSILTGFVIAIFEASGGAVRNLPWKIVGPVF
jgi:hypothetical protein